jgi:hypothetical protein
MNLESDLYQINFCSRRKTALSQTKYLAINFSNFGMEDEGNFIRGTKFQYPKEDILDNPWRTNNPWKKPESWQIEEVDSCPTLKPIEMPKIKPVEPFPEMRFIIETVRLDSHKPWGDHLNYEFSMKKIGSKSGRTLNLLNLHIPLGDNEDE